MKHIFFTTLLLSAVAPLVTAGTPAATAAEVAPDSVAAVVEETAIVEEKVVIAQEDTATATAFAVNASPLSYDFSGFLLDENPPLDLSAAALHPYERKPMRLSIYELPYSLTGRQKDWKRLWINTAVLAGAYIGTLVVLECLPEDATTWNRAALQRVPPFKRWFRHIFKKGPEWDHDNAIFNYVLHPYAGAAYFMAARSCGFNFWQSFLYSACISTIGWEFGIEAFMERPSIQDIFITPIVGSVIGELFYKLKRNIVSHDYTLAGNRILGNVVVFLIDPVNEVVGLFAGNEARKLHLGRKAPKIESSLLPGPVGNGFGFTFTCRF